MQVWYGDGGIDRSWWLRRWRWREVSELRCGWDGGWGWDETAGNFTRREPGDKVTATGLHWTAPPTSM